MQDATVAAVKEGSLGSDDASLEQHRAPKDLSDRVAYAFTRLLRFFADTFFARRYGHRAVVLETVAAVPGMVGGALQHLRALRRMESDHGWIRALLDEAENERMHLMTFVNIARPSWLERMLILVAQGVFYNCFFVLYLCSPKTAHRVVGYFEEEAVRSYTEYLSELDNGACPNVPAPRIAIDYWKLAHDARLREVIAVVRADEAHHRDVNHEFADRLADGDPRCATSPSFLRSSSGPAIPRNGSSDAPVPTTVTSP